MRQTLILTAAVAGLCSPAAAQLPAPAPAPALCNELTEQEATAIVEEFSHFMNTLAAALESATDTATADAAAQSMQSLKLNSADLQRKLDLISAASPEIQQKLLPVILSNVVEHGQRASDAIRRIRANNYYNSEALRECIAELHP